MSRQKISEGRHREIALLAEFVADEHFPKGPVNPSVIIKSLDLTISYGHYGDYFDGMLEYRGGRFHVFCNMDRLEVAGRGRTLFTLGHELGHYLIDEHRRALERGAPCHGSTGEFRSSTIIEREADLFASHLLLPSIRFHRRATKSPKGIPGILKLAESFHTSITSTAVRYIDDEIIPRACMIRWKATGAYSWKRLSSSARRAGLRKTVENISQIPKDSATRLAIDNVNSSADGVMEKGSTTSAWFPYIRTGGAADNLLMEQVISLGRFGFLTFLFPI